MKTRRLSTLLSLLLLVLTGCNEGHEQVLLDIKSCDLKPATSCPGADLSGQNLSGMDLHSSVFVGTNFDGADLSETILLDANLTNASMRGTNLLGANLINAKLDGIVWENTTCPDGTNSDDNLGTCCGHLNDVLLLTEC